MYIHTQHNLYIAVVSYVYVNIMYLIILYIKSVHIIHIHRDTQKCVCKSFLKILEKTQTILVFHFIAGFQFHYSYLNCFKYFYNYKTKLIWNFIKL